MATRRLTTDAATSQRLGVIVIEPLPVIRAGLVLLIEADAGMEVLAQAGDAEGALEAIAHLRRSQVLVLIGLGLHGHHDAAWLIRAVRERHPGSTVVAMGANADAAAVSRALFVGADGFVDKNVEAPAFVQALRRAGEHEMVLEGPSPSEVGAIAGGIERRRDIDVRLTAREREVLAIAAEGLTAREIAARLGVRERTVTTHLARIYGKLGVSNRLAAIRTAARSGLVSVGE